MTRAWIKCGWCNGPLVEDAPLLVFTHLTCRECGGRNEIVSTSPAFPDPDAPHVARMVPKESAPQGSHSIMIPTIPEHEGARRLCELIHRGKR